MRAMPFPKDDASRPAMRIDPFRGAYDCAAVQDHKQGRSRYGAKRPKE